MVKPHEDDWLTRTGDLLLPRFLLDILEYYYIGNDMSIIYITNWSLMHLISGFIFGYILFKYMSDYNYYLTGFYVHTLWEIYQIVVKNTPIFTLRGQVDTILDTLFFMLGMYIYDNFIR